MARDDTTRAAAPQFDTPFSPEDAAIERRVRARVRRQTWAESSGTVGLASALTSAALAMVFTFGHRERDGYYEATSIGADGGGDHVTSPPAAAYGAAADPAVLGQHAAAATLDEGAATTWFAGPPGFDHLLSPRADAAWMPMPDDRAGGSSAAGTGGGALPPATADAQPEAPPVSLPSASPDRPTLDAAAENPHAAPDPAQMLLPPLPGTDTPEPARLAADTSAFEVAGADRGARPDGTAVAPSPDHGSYGDDGVAARSAARDAGADDAARGAAGNESPATTTAAERGSAGHQRSDDAMAVAWSDADGDGKDGHAGRPRDLPVQVAAGKEDGASPMRPGADRSRDDHASSRGGTDDLADRAPADRGSADDLSDHAPTHRGGADDRPDHAPTDRGGADDLPDRVAPEGSAHGSALALGLRHAHPDTVTAEPGDAAHRDDAMDGSHAHHGDVADTVLIAVRLSAHMLKEEEAVRTAGSHDADQPPVGHEQAGPELGKGVARLVETGHFEEQPDHAGRGHGGPSHGLAESEVVIL
ncbi:MAG: hypothetical protein IRZ13_10835 [Acetobacteraceae bacterium]|nr:hypothetical protein [Acetobacteraceae bacterium]